MKYVVAIFITINFLSCSMIERFSNDEYFEGFVEFNTEITAKDNTINSEARKIYGAKEVTYVNKEGFFSREFIDSNAIIVRKQIFRPDSMSFYEYEPGSDTIIKSDVRSDKNDKNMWTEDVPAVKILNQQCRGIKCMNKLFDTSAAIYHPYNITYYFDSSRRLSPASFKGVKWEGIETTFSKYPFVTVGYTCEFPDVMTVACKAVRVVEVKIESFHFDVPKNKVIIEQQ